MTRDSISKLVYCCVLCFSIFIAKMKVEYIRPAYIIDLIEDLCVTQGNLLINKVTVDLGDSRVIFIISDSFA